MRKELEPRRRTRPHPSKGNADGPQGTEVRDRDRDDQAHPPEGRGGHPHHRRRHGPPRRASDLLRPLGGDRRRRPSLEGRGRQLADLGRQPPACRGRQPRPHLRRHPRVEDFIRGIERRKPRTREQAPCINSWRGGAVRSRSGAPRRGWAGRGWLPLSCT